MTAADVSPATQMFGRVAVHNKLISQDQWNEALQFHLRTGGELPAEDILVQKGFMSQKHVDAIRKKLGELESKNKPAEAAPPPPPPAPVVTKSAAPSPADSGGIPFSEDEDSAPPTSSAAAESPFEEEAAEAKADPTPQPSPTPMPAVQSSIRGAGGAVFERIPSPVKPNQVDPFAMGLLKDAFRLKASDVHFSSGVAPFYRINGVLTFTQHPPLKPDQAKKIVLGFMNDEQQQHWLRNHDLDFSYQIEGLGRFRVNALEQFRGPDIVFRCIPLKPPGFHDLGLPESLEKLTEWHQGLVLITGPAGSGKSTTAASLIDLINSRRKDHIITVEDPVEYLQPSKGCNVTQRQVPVHTKDFASALRAALREDPDIIMIGEMRDLETVSLAIRAAETGHLVIGTLQTKNAPRTVDRVVDVFPSDQQAQIRTMLSESLRGIVSQQLIPTADGKGRVVAVEIMFITGAISNLIRDSRTFQLHSIMETGKKAGHKLMDESLMELIRSGRITKDEAIKAADNPKKFR